MYVYCVFQSVLQKHGKHKFGKSWRLSQPMKTSLCNLIKIAIKIFIALPSYSRNKCQRKRLKAQSVVGAVTQPHSHPPLFETLSPWVTFVVFSFVSCWLQVVSITNQVFNSSGAHQGWSHWSWLESPLCRKDRGRLQLKLELHVGEDTKKI